MAGQKSVKLAQKPGLLITTEKEIPPPKKARRTVSISTLFEQTKELKRKTETGPRDTLAPKAAGVFKPHAASRHSREYENPIFRKFQGATKAYRDGVGGSNAEQLESVYREIIAHVEGLAVAGDTLNSEEGKLTVDLDTIAAEYTRHANALGEDRLQMQRSRPDGSPVAEERKLGDTMATFSRVLDQKRNEVDQFLRELKGVDAEISAVKQDIERLEQKEAKNLKRELDAQVALLVKQAETSNETTLKEIEKARKEDKRAVTAMENAFKEFMSKI